MGLLIRRQLYTLTQHACLPQGVGTLSSADRVHANTCQHATPGMVCKLEVQVKSVIQLVAICGQFGVLLGNFGNSRRAKADFATEYCLKAGDREK